MSQDRQLYRFLVRGGLSNAIAALDEIPLDRELVVETDTLKFKIGDGVKRYSALPYLGATRDQITMGAGDRINPVPIGTKALVPVTYDCEVRRFVLLIATSDNQAGSVSLDLRRVSLANYTPGRPGPAETMLPGEIGIAGGVKASGTVAGWSAKIQRNDILTMHVSSRTENVTHIALALETEKSR